jgi:hypothetical protein
MDLVTLMHTYAHYKELQAIMTPPLITKIHKSTKDSLNISQPAISSPAVPW